MAANFDLKRWEHILTMLNKHFMQKKKIRFFESSNWISPLKATFK